MFISATELRNHLGKYLALAKTQDFFITRQGQLAAKLVSTDTSSVNATSGNLRFSEKIDRHSIRKEKLTGYIEKYLEHVVE